MSRLIYASGVALILCMAGTSFTAGARESDPASDSVPGSDPDLTRDRGKDSISLDEAYQASDVKGRTETSQLVFQVQIKGDTVTIGTRLRPNDDLRAKIIERIRWVIADEPKYAGAAVTTKTVGVRQVTPLSLTRASAQRPGSAPTTQEPPPRSAPAPPQSPAPAADYCGYNFLPAIDKWVVRRHTSANPAYVRLEERFTWTQGRLAALRPCFRAAYESDFFTDNTNSSNVLAEDIDDWTSNLPLPYLDTRAFDPPSGLVYSVGTPLASQLTAGVQYYIKIYTDNGGPYDIAGWQGQRGHYVLDDSGNPCYSTWCVFADQTMDIMRGRTIPNLGDV